MGGKRQANVLSALIQNFDTVEDVIKTSANSANSALKENEKYLSSIQGRIDQFNNAMQAMWSNTLDSDAVKFVINLATQIIKLVDNVGMLTTAMAGVFVYLTAFKQQTPLALLQQLLGVITSIGSSIKANGLGRWIGALLGVAPAMKAVTVETVANTVATQMNDAAKAKQMMSEMGLATATGTLSVAQREQASTAILSAMSTGQLTMAQGNAMLAMLGYSGATMAADGSLKVLDTTTKSFMATNPVGWILLVVSAIAMVAVGLSQIPSKVERLQKKLQDLQSELQDIQTELKSVNSELETTEERMAELLAKDSLTFVEQEELKNLQKQNAELQRQLDLLNARDKRTKSNLADTFNDTMDEDVNSGYRIVSEYNISGQSKDIGWTGKDKGWGAWWRKILLGNAYTQEEMSGREYIDELLDRYQSYQTELADVETKIINSGDDTKAVKKLEKRKEKIESEMGDITSIIDEKTTSWEVASEGLDYGIDDKTDEWLDYINNTRDKIEIGLGSNNAEANAISRIFGKDANAALSDSIDEYVQQLKKGDMSAKHYIANIISNNNTLVKDLEASGLSAEKAIEYFTKLGSEANYATIDGKIKEVSKAAATFESLLGGSLFNVDDVDIGLAELFDKEGKIIQTKLSQVFNDTSDQTREDITNLLEGSYEQIKNDTTDTKRLLTGFGLKTTQQVLQIQNKLLGEQNLELFPNLKGEIEGIIDKFAEFSKAVGGVVDALDTLDQARAEEAYSGSISIETLENLMKYTDDYAQLVEIDETGAITLATNAEELLIGKRIEKIKTDAAAAVQTAQSNLEQANYNAKAVNETGPIQEALTAATDGLAGAWSYLGSIIGDITDGNFSGMFERASAAYSKVTAGREEKRTQVNVSVEDAQKALDNALRQQQIADALTSDNVKKKYSSEEASGGNKNKEDAEKDKIEEDWEKLVNQYENQLALLSNERDLIQAEIDKAEARGGKASTKYYEDLKKNSEDEKNILIQKKAALEEYLTANAGAIDQDTWTEYNNEINETAVAIKECEINTIEWAEAIREIDLHYFEQITDEVSRLGDELDFVNSLLEDEEVADENGNWSSAALTRMGMYTNQMELAAAEAARYQDEIDKLNGQYDDGTLSEEQYQEKLSELVSGQQDAIMSYEDAKDSIVELNEARIDAIRTGIEKEIDAYADLTDAKKEELDAERDLYDFRKDIKNQTKDISELERRIAALSGSSAASDVAERRKLEAQLLEAKEGLNDTYYNHSRDAQSTALDEEAEAYTESKERYIEQLEEQLKDTETLIQNSIMDVMLNADIVYTELNELADLYGIDLSDSLTQPWKDASAQATAWKNELQESMTAGEYAALIGEGGAITAFANGVATKLEGSWSKAQTAATNYAGYLTGTELKNKFTNTLTGFGNQIQIIIDKWNGVKAAADAAYSAQTRTATVGGNPAVTETPQPVDPPKKETPTETTKHKPAEKQKELTEAQKMVAKITRFGSAQGSGMNAGKKGDNGVVTWDRKEYNVQNSGTTHGKGSNLYKAAVEHLKFSDRQIFGYQGGVYGYLDGVIQKLEGRTLSKKGYNNLVAYAKGQYASFAKGTTGITRDQWAITDESWIGEEITLAAGKSGRLRGIMKGSAVLPSDISENLVEWGKLNPDDAHSGNITNNYVNAPTNDVDVANSLTIDGKSSSTQAVHESIRDTYELIEDTVKNIDGISQHYKPSVDEALTTPWVDATDKVGEFNTAANTNYDDIVSHTDENKEFLETALNTPYTNVIDDIDDFSQHAQKASVDDVITHANEQNPTLTTALSTGFNNAKTATDAFKTSGTSAVNAVKDAFTNGKTGLIKALNDTTSAAQKTKQAIDNVPTYSGGSGGSAASVQAGQHYISSLGKNVTLSSNVTKWSSVATQALQKTGQYSHDNLLLLLHQMQTESSGNQNAINNWDINAKNGTPSKGLMQVIDPTFQAYAMNGYNKDIYDPLSNIIAAIRYTTSRYGSLSRGWRGSGYAKGTAGTSKDEWALTNEFGPELTMYATPEGTLSFMRAGSTVVPADITANLVEWGKLNPEMLNVNGTPNLNMISNAINKPELNVTFDALVKAENITEETLPAVRKLVTQELNRFTKELNYALKGKGAR